MDRKLIIQEISIDNLCTYFVLPLLKLSKNSFIRSNFVNSYLTLDGKNLLVQVYDVVLLSRSTYIHPNFKSLFIKDGFFYLMYEIPNKWSSDVSTFIKGKYSRMSKDAHTHIRLYSSLDYKKSDNVGRTTTDARLLALTRDPELRAMWIREYHLEPNALDSDDELLEVPPSKSFIKIEDLQSYKKEERSVH